ncbi:MAG TPA: ribonuclease J [Firmicutes bacterium]|nr:ribonuclease J [Bacillota bacterium]
MVRKSARPPLRIVPLGGLGEIGKNMTVIECENDILVIDCGLAFPEEEMLGVDIVIPDISYLRENMDKVRGVVLTHGHEDHIGAIPYLLPQLPVPFYGTPLTLGLVRGKLVEAGLAERFDGRALQAGEKASIGCFEVELFRVTHSVPDSVGLAIRTPAGLIVYTSDFKFDQTPVDGQVTDIGRLGELGQEGVLVLLSDSTGAERHGFTPSEKTVGKTLQEIFRSTRSRVLVASFATHLHRIQQVITAAYQQGRYAGVIGRSMEDTVQVAMSLGYLQVPEGMLLELEELDGLPPDKVVILTTGSQGEPMSALTRMAAGEHKRVTINPGDTVVIAATPVPGNEKMVARTIDNLYRRGARVIYGTEQGVHVSGHGSQEELKMMLNLTRPRFFVPIHGEYRHLVHHAALAEAVGIPRRNILIGENGSILEFSKGVAAVTGQVESGLVMVDGLGVGDVGSVVLRDRKQLAEDGILVVVIAVDQASGLLAAGPELVSRGFVYVRESEALLERARATVREAMERRNNHRTPDWAAIKNVIRDSLSRALFEETGRRPMILPIVIEV